MPEAFVKILGEVESIDGRKLAVGIDYDSVKIGDFRLASAALEDFARLFVAASWAAGSASRLFALIGGDDA